MESGLLVIIVSEAGKVTWGDRGELQVRYMGDVLSVLLSGEVDMASLRTFPPADIVIGERDTREVKVDLTGLRFMDSAGVRWLLNMCTAAKARNVPVTVYVLEASLIVRMLTVLRADRLFPIEVVDGTSSGT